MDYHSLINHSPAAEHFVLVRTITDKTAMNNHVQVFVWTKIFISLG